MHTGSGHRYYTLGRKSIVMEKLTEAEYSNVQREDSTDQVHGDLIPAPVTFMQDVVQ